MTVDPQSATLAFLTSPRVQGVPAAEIATVRTHLSIIVLAGARACKLKRAVRLPYVDLSTPALRLQACERELALNRRTAPALYLGVRRITRQDDGQLSFDGPGELVDAVVQMRRFADDALLETRVTRDGLSVALADRLAGVIADFHDRAEIAPQVDMPARLMGVIDANAQIFAALPSLPADKTASLDAALRRELARHAPLLRARARAGKVRRCHGDLHLANICLIDGEPTLFDCLEFDVSLSTIDVLYDLAFLLMDLWSRGLAPQANQVLNRYLDRRGDDDGLPLMPAFMGLRAAIRAHVVATQAAAAAGPERARLQAQALRYLDTGLACLEPRAAWLVAVGGLSGSGKSVLAAAIAPAIGPAGRARVVQRPHPQGLAWGGRASAAAGAGLPPGGIRTGLCGAGPARARAVGRGVLRDCRCRVRAAGRPRAHRAGRRARAGGICRLLAASAARDLGGARQGPRERPLRRRRGRRTAAIGALASDIALVGGGRRRSGAGDGAICPGAAGCRRRGPWRGGAVIVPSSVRRRHAFQLRRGQ